MAPPKVSFEMASLKVVSKIEKLPKTMGLKSGIPPQVSSKVGLKI